MTGALARWLLPAIVVSAVVAAIIAGLLLIGSPAEQRVLALDRHRESDLSNITRATTRYWDLHSSLPQSLDELAKYPSGYAFSITDPETGAPYEYRITGEKTFELCATFGAPTPKSPDEGLNVPAYRHDAGRQCFDLTASPD
jgi:hypothetical protein